MRTEILHRAAAKAALLLLAATVLGLAGGRDAAAREGTRWGAQYFPNTELTTQDGEKVRFFDDVIEGKTVAINFIYTSCKNSCPAETAKMRQVQTLLGDRVGKDVFMYSISIDPEHDTPEVLKAYAEKFHAGPGWTFLTGDREEIILLRKKLGLFIAELSDENPDDHNVSLLVGNQPTGRWIKRSPFDNAQVLAQLLTGFVQNYEKPDARAANRTSYENAVIVKNITDGHYVFRTRCSSCHTVGKGDAVGPDLAGVTERRDSEWLIRWIREPDKMLEEGDPIAKALYEQFQELEMPNLKLSKGDAEAVLEYIKTETLRARGIQVPEKHASTHEH